MNNTRSILKTSSTTGIIIDVRESKEYKEKRIPGSINLPSSTFSIIQYEPYREQMIYLVCQSGSRANAIRNKLLENGFDQVTVLEKHIDHLDVKSELVEEVHGWTVDRQFRMTLGVLLAIFLTGYFMEAGRFIIIPIILSTGLIITSIIDRCYMRMGIAMLPWNRDK